MSFTAKENPYPLDEVVQDARDVLKQVGEQSAHVVAHSLRGSYVLQLAASPPADVRTLTLTLTLMEPLIPSPAYAQWSGPLAG